MALTYTKQNYSNTWSANSAEATCHNDLAKNNSQLYEVCWIRLSPTLSNIQHVTSNSI